MASRGFTQQQADTLRATLAELDFASAPPKSPDQAELHNAYLGFYGLDFSARFPGSRYALGRLALAGFEIAVQYWLPLGARGTLVIVHGYYDHVGIYRHAIEFGLQHGLAVLAFDLPGHGLSSGERAAIDSFDQYGDVLEQLLNIARHHLPSPWYGLGQSTGGAILLNHLWRYESFRSQPWLEYRALCAPLILPRSWGRGRIAYSLLHRWLKTLPRGRSRSSHDREFIRFIDELDCLQSRRLSVRWVGAMKRWDEQFQHFSPLHVPLLVAQGSQDETVDWRYNLQQIRSRLPLAEVVMIDGAGHQLVNEREDFRRQVFAQISRFFFNS